jgi:ADP-dependent NAD(P)H-hydrate dehydratase / NAD(P)H-hydrate epimerase
MTAQTLLRSAALREIESAHGSETPPMMERAGKAAAELALHLQSNLDGSPLILAGPGNNGGDALVVARILKERGLDPVVVFFGSADKLPIDARKAWERWSAIGQCHHDFPDRQYGLLIDGLFGIGLARPLEEPWLSLIARINAYRGPVLAIDCPSGLNADTGTLNPIAVRATHTITFIANKPGLLTLDGPDHAGEITLADIGLGDDVKKIAPSGLSLSKASEERTIHASTSSARTAQVGHVNASLLFSASLSPRQRNSHKGSYGSAGIIGGAPTMAGAALLAGRAALKLGAGRVFVGMLERIAVDHGQPELMLRAARDVFDVATAIGIGPGLAQSDEALQLLRQAIAAPLPLVMDADALNLLAAHPTLARLVVRREHGTLITPHPVEAARLLGTTVDTIQVDRIASAIELARRFNACVVLKGCGSIITTPDGRWFINTTGNPGLASGGTGDVLTGFCVALLAQGWPVEATALGATWLHGAAADALGASGEGPIGIAAGELIAPAQRILNQLIADQATQSRMP